MQDRLAHSRPSCRADSSSGWWWPGPSPPGPSLSSPTRPPAISTPGRTTTRALPPTPTGFCFLADGRIVDELAIVLGAAFLSAIVLSDSIRLGVVNAGRLMLRMNAYAWLLDPPIALDAA